MTGLSLIRLKPDMARVSAWAADRRMLAPGGDLGYALHALLAAAFDGGSVKPFALIEERLVGRLVKCLYGYATMAPETLGHRAARGPAEVACALRLDGLEFKRMPEAWSVGRRFAFRIAFVPNVRTDRGTDRSRAREIDAYVAAKITAGDAPAPSRAEVYARWLARELGRGGAAQVIKARLLGHRRVRALRGSGDRRRVCETPEAVFAGTLEVLDGEAFAALLARGAGRHRAFGYGMLLLKPLVRA